MVSWLLTARHRDRRRQRGRLVSGLSFESVSLGDPDKGKWLWKKTFRGKGGSLSAYLEKKKKTYSLSYGLKGEKKKKGKQASMDG